MSKFPFLAVWTIAIAAIGFGIGRFSAPGLDARTEQAATAPASTNNNAQVSAALSPQPSVAPVADVPAEVSTRVMPAPGKRSYAADHQQLQALLALAATNPQAAMERAQTFRGAIKAKAEVAILDIWGAQDPNAAWNWVTNAAPDNKAYYIQLLEVIGRNEPRTAIGFAEQFLANHRELRKDIYQSLLAGIAQGGAYDQATRLLASAVLEPDVKAELTGALMADWAAYEPQAAMQWLASQPGDLDEAALVRLGQSWAATDPQSATQYIVNLRGDARETLLVPAFNRWLASDPSGAANWLAASQRDAGYDPLINELATSPAMSTQVKTALGWVERMKDHQQRLNTLTSILSAVRQQDPAAATAYLRDINYLSDAERSQLMADLVLN